MAFSCKMRGAVAFIVLLNFNQVTCFVSPTRRVSFARQKSSSGELSFAAFMGRRNDQDGQQHQHEGLVLEEDFGLTSSPEIPSWAAAAAVPAVLTLFTTPLPAEAAGTVPTALWAYGHYVSLMLCFGALVAERFLLKPGMTEDEEKDLNKIGASYLFSFILLLVTGYFRTAEFGKGVNFYSHEILFWIKMSFVGVTAGLSTFPVITYIKRRTSSAEFSPISDKLYSKLKTVLNAEISALLSIPLVASLMSRGVLYFDGFPWQAGVASILLLTVGSTFLYSKQALTWTEELEKVEQGEESGSA